MDISITKSGDFIYGGVQKVWSATGDGSVMHTATFAGLVMTALLIEEGAEAGQWELRYNGFRAGSFPSVVEAKDCAPRFAADVLERMKASVGPNPSAIATNDPVATLSDLIDSCGAFPDEVGRMKALIVLIKQEQADLREGVLALNPEAQLARESELLGRIEGMAQTLREAVVGKKSGNAL